MLNLASFWKTEACGQTVLPDRSILIGQKLAETPKFKNSDATFWVIFKQCASESEWKCWKILKKTFVKTQLFCTIFWYFTRKKLRNLILISSFPFCCRCQICDLEWLCFKISDRTASSSSKPYFCDLRKLQNHSNKSTFLHFRKNKKLCLNAKTSELFLAIQRWMKITLKRNLEKSSHFTPTKKTRVISSSSVKSATWPPWARLIWTLILLAKNIEQISKNSKCQVK